MLLEVSREMTENGQTLRHYLNKLEDSAIDREINAVCFHATHMRTHVLSNHAHVRTRHHCEVTSAS